MPQEPFKPLRSRPIKRVLQNAEESRRLLKAAEFITAAGRKSKSIQELSDKTIPWIHNFLGTSTASIWYRNPETERIQLVASQDLTLGKEGNEREMENLLERIRELEEKANDPSSETFRAFKKQKPVHFAGQEKPGMPGSVNGVGLPLDENHMIWLYNPFGGATELTTKQKNRLATVKRYLTPAVTNVHGSWQKGLNAVRQELALKPHEFRPYESGLQMVADAVKRLFGEKAGVLIVHKDKTAGHTEYRVRANAGFDKGIAEALNGHLMKNSVQQIDLEALKKTEELKKALKRVHGLPFVSPQSESHVLLLTGVKLSPYELHTLGELTNESMMQLETHRIDSTLASGALDSRYFRDELDRLMAKASEKKPFALVYADARKFKRINEYLSHGIGNKVIKAFGHILKRSAKETLDPREGVEYRIGGMGMGGGSDEFVIAAHGPESGDALREFMRRANERSKRTSGALQRIVRAEFKRNAGLWRSYVDKVRKDLMEKRAAEITDEMVRKQAEEDIGAEALASKPEASVRAHLRQLRGIMESKARMMVTDEEAEREAEAFLPKLLSLKLDLGHVSATSPRPVGETLGIAEEMMKNYKKIAEEEEAPRPRSSRW
ncbi:hypothetical protein AUJ16_04315 [Candidatus Micrarchaeota archaeon CG1_02_60_51]|nr:MAG: hypothetical protein AUJ16_04315 [Candidatus Micrarchaeota archaeon CG1_02_60_51]